jgi:hypothetical protein
VISPPPERVYSVRATVPGTGTGVRDADLDELSRRLGAKSAEGLRRGVSGLALDLAPDDGAVALTATVNDWNAGTAATRIITLLAVRAGDGWDIAGTSVSAEPARPQPDIPVQGRTSTDKA